MEQPLPIRERRKFNVEAGDRRLSSDELQLQHCLAATKSEGPGRSVARLVLVLFADRTIRVFT